MCIKERKKFNLYIFKFLHKILWEDIEESNNHGYLFVVGKRRKWVARVHI